MIVVHRADEGAELQAHVAAPADGRQAGDRFPSQAMRPLRRADVALQVRRRDLDDPLEELGLRALVAGQVPEPFERLVAFPPVGEVVEIDPVEIRLVLAPALRVAPLVRVKPESVAAAPR